MYTQIKNINLFMCCNLNFDLPWMYRFSVVLQGDPHLHTILPTLVVAMAMMYLDAFSGADKDER